MVKISIIVPVFNTSKYLKECAQSLFSQTLEDIEIIFVDDGSTDSSLSILKSFKDPRAVVLSQPHSGQSNARNLGLKHAKGEYVGFVDSDDWVKPEMFEKLYNQNGDISMCSFVEPDSYMNLDVFKGAKKVKPEETFDYIFRICVSPCNKIYSRKILEGIEFIPNLAFEDNLFFFQTYLKAKEVNIINEPLYFYRRHEGSTTHNKEKMKDIVPVLNLVEDYLKSTKYWEELKEKFYTHKENTINYWKKKSQPKISVITVCKNEAGTIEKTILSVLNQTYKNFEIVVIDSLSTDGTIDVIEKYKNEIAYFKSEKDKGIYNAMNKGIKAAKGDIFYFLNANDVLSSADIFEKVIEKFSIHPDAKLLFGNFNFMENGKFHHKVDFEKNYNSHWLFRHNSMCQQALFYKKELFTRFGKYDESYRIAGDTERNMNFLIKHRVQGVYFPISIVDFSIGGISGSLKARKILIKEEKRLYKKYYSDGIFDYFMQKLLKLLKYFAPKIFLFFSSGHNREKINVIKV